MDRRRFVPTLAGLEVRELLSVTIPAASASPAAAAAPAATVAPTATPAILIATPDASPAATTPSTPAVTTTSAPKADSAPTSATPLAAPTSTLAATPKKAATPIRVHQIDPTIQPLRNQRIERLPTLLYSLDTQRRIPRAVTAALQMDLELIRNQLTPPPTGVLTTFNEALRSLLGSSSITASGVQKINAAFGAVLRQSSAPEDIVARFQADMLELAKIDAHQRNPSVLLANDYSLVAQLCMGVGINIVIVPTARQARQDALIAAREQYRAMHAQQK